MRSRPDRPHPLGATWDGRGANFALFAEHATAVDLCLFERVEAGHEADRIRLAEPTDQIWRRLEPSARPRFNPHKVVLDPYAKSIGRTVSRGDEIRHLRVLQLIMDSLRYWVLKMRVDGFRFDRASALARELHAFDRLSAIFDIIHQDPVLSPPDGATG